MPIKINDKLPAKESLENENIFVMTETRAKTQDIRPLKIVILNLMPTKVTTETQLLRMLSNSPLQIDIELLQTATHKASHADETHMLTFYKTFDEIKENKYDGMIVTGAPVEQLEFEEVDYSPSFAEFSNGRKQMYIRPFISAGAPRQDFTITTAFRNTICRKRFSAFSRISRLTFFTRLCAALTIHILFRTRAIQKPAFQTLLCAKAFRFSLILKCPEFT